MATMDETDLRIAEFLASRGAHFAAQSALKTLLYMRDGSYRDPVDAAEDARIVYELLRGRCTAAGG